MLEVEPMSSKSPVLVPDSSSSRARATRVVHAPWLAVLAVGALAACAAGEGDDGPPPPAFGGVAGAAGSTGQLPAGSAGNPSNLGGGQAGGTGVTPVNPGGAGQGGAGGAQSVPPPAGSAGAAGGAGAPPVGSAGAPPVGSAGAAGAAPQDPPGEDPPPSGPDIDCPEGATFCSGFESNEFPAGTQFHSVGSQGPDGAFSFDTSDPFAGNQALLIPATGGGFQYRALAVPVPGQNFWVRLYMRLSVPLGDGNHDSVFGASTGAISADVNNEALIELSEQFDNILLNTDDQLFDPPTNTVLPANEWLCMEAHYDSAAGVVQIFADGEEVISATGYRAGLNLQSFRIGYMRYNTDRAVAFDDVVVAPNRIGCD